MRLMGATEGVEGDTKIATPLVRVDPGASTGLAFSGNHPALATARAIAVVPCSRSHWRSNVAGLW